MARLDRELGVQTGVRDSVVGVSVVRDDPPRVRELGHVLAERREHRREAAFAQSRRGGDRVLERLAGHETTHAPPDEAVPREVLAEPPMVGRPQDRVASQGHAGSLANGIDRPGIDADLA
jgi:hypothetical protein